MPGIIDPHPLPPTPNEGCSFGGDLRSTTNWRERALADGRATIHEHRRRVEGASSLRHTRLYAPRREVFPLDELDKAVPSLYRYDHRSQEYSQAQRAHEAAGHSLSDVHRDSLDYAHRQEPASANHLAADADVDFPALNRTQPQGCVHGGTPLHRRQRHALEVTVRPHTCAAPLNAKNAIDAFGREDLETVVWELDVLEDPKPDGLACLIQ
jgi:hypothetical protein